MGRRLSARLRRDIKPPGERNRKGTDGEPEEEED